MTHPKREVLVSTGSIPFSGEVEDSAAKFVPKIVAWFASLPPEPVIRWTCASLSEEHPVGFNFVDVEVPPLLHELKAGWVWTILPPEEEGPLGALDIPLEYDLEEGWSTIHISGALSRWVADEVGRADVHFSWDPSLLSIWYWILNDPEAKDEETIEIGEGLEATEQAMEALWRCHGRRQRRSPRRCRRCATATSRLST